MGISKVVYGDTTLIDLTNDNIEASAMLSGFTAHSSDGEEITGSIASKSSTDLTVSGATVSVPAGYYEENASKSVASGSVAVNSTTISQSPTISIGNDGLITSILNTSSEIGASVTAGYITSASNGTVYVNASNTLQLSTESGQTITPGTAATVLQAGRYITGAITISGDSDLIAANIADDTTIFGVTGTLERATAMTAAQILTAVQAGWV